MSWKPTKQKKIGSLEEDNRMSRKPEDGDASLSYKRKAGGERWETAVGKRQGRTNGKDMMKRMTAEA